MCYLYLTIYPDDIEDFEELFGHSESLLFDLLAREGDETIPEFHMYLKS